MALELERLTSTCRFIVFDAVFNFSRLFYVLGLGLNDSLHRDEGSNCATARSLV